MFNVRVYGLLIHNNQILIVKEPIKNNQVIKFPGGGLEFGEGTIDGLKREFKEELGVDITGITHF
ncbi:MAG: NUDIX domain-containing protein, partial [Chitinophagales bacterium]|nr:NUDIX domain-containing protein [Chitinophagales bacterium]